MGRQSQTRLSAKPPPPPVLEARSPQKRLAGLVPSKGPEERLCSRPPFVAYQQPSPCSYGIVPGVYLSQISPVYEDTGHIGLRECMLTQLCLTLAKPWTVTHQAPLSMGFFRQEY